VDVGSEVRALCGIRTVCNRVLF